MMRIIAVALLLAVIVHPAFGAVDAYMQIKGQGWDGPARIKLVDFNSTAIRPEEKSSGKFNTVHRMWAPIILTRELDAASPKLRQWCANGEHSFSISAYQTGGSGKPTLLYTVNFTGAKLTYHTSNSRNHTAESISFTFRKIEWSNAATQTTAIDNWQSGGS